MSRARQHNPFADPAARRPLDDQLAAGSADLGLSPAARGRLLDYLALLQRWNRAYNLTAVRDPQQMVIRLLLDSLSIVPWVHGPRVLDIGSGAGLPGIPLAIACPQLQVVLLDSNGKKVRFQRQAIADLGLANVSAEQARVEDFRPPALFDSIVSRAFAALPDFVAAAAPLCRPGGELLAMKGRQPAAEIEALPDDCRVDGSEPLAVAGLDAERWLVRICCRK